MLEVSALVRSLLFPAVPVLALEDVPGVTAGHLVETARVDVGPHGPVLLGHLLLGRTLLTHSPRTASRA